RRAPAVLDSRAAGQDSRSDATDRLDDLVKEPSPDPVDLRRARIARVVGLAKAIGYGLLLVAIVAFAIGFLTDFPTALVGITIGALIASTVILPIPIVLGYGIRAAERDERRST